MHLENKIEIQRKKLLEGNPYINLSDSCTIGNGIIQLAPEEKSKFSAFFSERKNELDLCFFVPASGSGSRMFTALYEFLNDPSNKEAEKVVDELIGNLEALALSRYLSDDWKEKINDNNGFDKSTFVEYLLTNKGLDLGNLPKGLIPFHIYENYITNPFQEHLIQGTEIGDTSSLFHFTINQQFEAEIESQIKKLERREHLNFNREFSEQDPSTDSIAFTEDLEPAFDEDGVIITRPAGHGALINNLNTIDADLIFTRNIDNVQHLTKAEISTETRRFLAGLLLEFQSDVNNVLKKIERGDAFSSSVSALNDKYDLRIPESIFADEQFMQHHLSRPMRVCGMVRNEGAPGGGPFWVKEGDTVGRQIIEKSQISEDPAQLKLLESATHFNPVELVCAVRDHHGNKFDLTEFVNSDQYFIVHKTQAGRSIRYIELPGLWNGAMANWLTLFVEIESACFSPVKTVMDLLVAAHVGSEE